MRLAAALLLAALAGCSSIGPATVPRDRFDYVSAISDSWKRQMLQNLLKVRYADAPVFLDVTSVINAYSFGGQLDAAAQYSPPERGDFSTASAATSPMPTGRRSPTRRCPASASRAA